MSIECIVQGCASNQFTRTLFRFPTNNSNLLQKWLEQFPKINFDVHLSYICENHFSSRDIQFGVNNVKMLVSEAVPKIDIVQRFCRFCLKNDSSLNLIDSTIKRIYGDLMNEEFQEGSELPNSTCVQCIIDFKYCSQFKNKVAESYTKIINLFRTNRTDPAQNDIPNLQSNSAFPVKQESLEDSEYSYYEHKKEIEPETVLKEDTKTSSIQKHAIEEKDELEKPKKIKIQSKVEDLLEQVGLEKEINKFNDKESLVKHKKTNVEVENLFSNRKFNCKICDKAVSSKTALRNHILKFHTEEKQQIEEKNIARSNLRVACLECGVLFSKNSISKHIKRIHRLVKDFQCDLCGTSCFLKRDIIDHMKTKHTLHREKINCQFCNKDFLRQSSLYYHIKFVHFKIMQEVCELCGLAFVSRAKYEDHYRAKHSLEKPFQCDQCQRAFSSSAVLYKHKASSHSKVQACCDICSKVYPSVKSMQNHKRLVHRDKIFVCEFDNCGMKFAARSLMRTHMANHSGIRRYQCEMCDSTYKKRDHLVRHMRSSHMKFEIKCLVADCKSKFKRKDFLRSHVLSNHKDIGEDAFKLLLDKIREMKEPEVKLQNATLTKNF